MSTIYSKLLRRTLAALGAGLALAATSTAIAQTVTLTGASGNSCTYSEMKVLPNGTIQVTCTGGNNNPPPVDPGYSTFSLSGSKNSDSQNTTGSITLTRTNGVGTGPAILWHTIDGDCWRGTAPIQMDAPGNMSINYTLLSYRPGAVCTITLHNPQAPHVLNEQAKSWTISIIDPAVNNPPSNGFPPAGCPALPDGAKYQTMDKWYTLNGAPATQWNAVDQLRMTSGQVAIYDVIAPPDPAASIVNKFTQGQQPASPTGTVVTEFTVSKCPGVISSSVPECYMQNTSTNQNEIRIYTAAIPYRSNQAEIGSRGCFAPSVDANGQPQKWYVNVRWTYSSCSFSNGCGFSMQWAQDSNY